MTRERVCLLVLLGMLSPTFLPQPAEGQVPVRMTVSPQVSYFDLNGIREFDLVVNEDAVAYLLRVGLIFPGNWGLEASGGVIPSHFNDGVERRSTRSFFLGGAATYRFVNSSPFTPLLSAGVEVLDLDASIGEAEANAAFVYGGGLEVSMGKKVALRLDAKKHKSEVTGCPPGPPPGPPPRKGGCGRGKGGPRENPGQGNGPNKVETAEPDVVAEFDDSPWLDHFEFSVGLTWQPWE
jgi:hypothetical protein